MGYLAISIITGFTFISVGGLMTGCLTINKFRHVRTGSWWVGVVTSTCPLACWFLMSYRRFYFSLLLANVTAAVALIGAILDGISSLHFKSITACASRGDIYPYKNIIYSGQSSDYLVAQSCFNSTEYIESDGCYCVSNRSCTEYIRYSDAKTTVNRDNDIRIYYTCYDTVGSFYETMTASCVFCSLLFLVALLHVLHIFFDRT